MHRGKIGYLQYADILDSQLESLTEMLLLENQMIHLMLVRYSLVNILHFLVCVFERDCTIPAADEALGG